MRVSKLRSGMFKSHWIVADMDGTLLPTPSKANGHYLPLSMSPCMESLSHFLRSGGNLVVVSTAGKRMWQQVYTPLNEKVFRALAESNASECGRLFICGFSGAALFVADASTKFELVEVEAYRTKDDGSTSTIIPPDTLDFVEEMLIRRATLRTLELAWHDPAYLKALSKKYHEPLTTLLREIYVDEKSDVYSTKLLTPERLKRYGEFLKDTNDALLDVQCVPQVVAGSRPLVAQYTILAVPMLRASEVFDDALIGELQRIGLTAKFQPNSVVITRTGLDKGVCVRHLIDYFGMDLQRALAFGDIPESIDKPLTLFPPMKFVSVSKNRADDAPHWVSVGDEELGTARFLNSLLEVISQQHSFKHSVSPRLFDDETISAALLRCHEKVSNASL